MSDNNYTKPLILVVGTLVATACAAWWWFANMELRWQANFRVSPAASENHMLGATLLLRQRGHAVTVAATLAELPLNNMPDGTIIMGDPSGIVAPEMAQQLLQWVRRGNTLVAQPRWINDIEQQQLSKPAEGSEDAPDEETVADAEAPEEEVDEEDEEDEKYRKEHAGHAHMTPAPPVADLVEVDPVAAHLGVRVVIPRGLPNCPKAGANKNSSSPSPAPKPCIMQAQRKPPPTRRLTLPGSSYALDLDPGAEMLTSMPVAKPHLWSDDLGTTVRVYGEGKGRIVMLATDFFGNSELRHYDHAELLLALASLNQASKKVTVVKFLDVLPWYKALWMHYSLLLLSLAALLALLLWAGVRRFGPVLPQPETERRSLMEHIDASGAWLWKADGGRQLLLEAAREETLALVRRRAPALFRLPAHDLPAALARLCGLQEQQVAAALLDDSAPSVIHFTRQIRTLQELRNHYER